MPRADQVRGLGVRERLDAMTLMGLCRAKTKRCDASGLPNSVTACLRRAVLQLWQEMNSDASGK